MRIPRQWSPTCLVMIGTRGNTSDPTTRAVVFRRLVERYEAMLADAPHDAPHEDMATLRTAVDGARDLLREAEREFWREAGFAESA